MLEELGIDFSSQKSSEVTVETQAPEALWKAGKEEKDEQINTAS